ncbi:MAG: threonine/serine dehydratase [Paraglaciecola sp.]|uniref:threonine ammonia-lyase n=1 Tax=Paraglaciecola sp. TaxID=1920173 RepID=UPI00326588CD
MINLSDIEVAAQRLNGVAVRTPVIENAQLNADVGARVLFKAENLQRGGSFKFRGAYNRLSQLNAQEKKAGVVAWSSGNHAQGVALAAKILGIPAAIVMPKDAPEIKVKKTVEYGAEIIGYDRYTESREEIGLSLANERGATLVPSYDDLNIIIGQGTAGLEFFQQCKSLGCQLDDLLVCSGGGGLIAGIATAFSQLSPNTSIYSVEPDAFDDHKRSLETGNIESNPKDARSICDALLAPEPGALTFPINSSLLKAGLSVSDDEVRAAMNYAFSTLKIVVEPGGVVALAALLSGKIDAKGKTIGLVISGGNVDPSLFSEVITQHS